MKHITKQARSAYYDGTGPMGNGPRTGLGMGYCNPMAMSAESLTRAQEIGYVPIPISTRGTGYVGFEEARTYPYQALPPPGYVPPVEDEGMATGTKIAIGVMAASLLYMSYRYLK